MLGKEIVGVDRDWVEWTEKERRQRSNKKKIELRKHLLISNMKMLTIRIHSTRQLNDCNNISRTRFIFIDEEILVLITQKPIFQSMINVVGTFVSERCWKMLTRDHRENENNKTNKRHEEI